MQNSEQTLDISWGAILKIAVALIIFYALFILRDVVIWFFFALIISILFEPAINFLRRLYVPKILSVVFIYVTVFGILGLIIYLMAPILIAEVKQFSQLSPQYFEQISPIFKDLKIEAFQSLDSLIQTITGNLEKISASVFNALFAFFGGLASALFIISISFFLSIEEKGVENVLRLLTPKKHEEYVLSLFERCQKKVSGWFGARILACIFIAVAFFIVLFFFQIKYAFILALLAGILNIIPFLGPLGMGILLVISVGIADSWLKALIILIAFVIIQQIENSIISPILMKKIIGLPPVLVLLSVVAGSIMFGFLGAIFAIPVFGIIYEFTKEFLERKREEEVQII